MNVNQPLTTVDCQGRRLAQPVSVQRTKALLAGLCLGVAMLGHAYGKETQ